MGVAAEGRAIRETARIPRQLRKQSMKRTPKAEQGRTGRPTSGGAISDCCEGNPIERARVAARSETSRGRR